MLIALSAGASVTAPQVRLNSAYVAAVLGAGLVPVIVPPHLEPDAAHALLDGVAGLVLTGGEDVDPQHYGAPPHPALGRTHPGRDRTEIALLQAAHARRTPTLAICRGLQVANVALGGTLVQDLPSQRGAHGHALDQRRHHRVHDVHVAAASRLASALGTGTPRVNSMHHQALDRVADALVVSARAGDDTIEGAEARDPRWWMVGVQWHPEELTGSPEPWDRDLFAAFADAVRAQRPG